MKLPDRAQSRPAAVLNVQPDFYVERRSTGAAVTLPGFRIFVDGPVRDRPDEAARAREIREDLADRGYRVIAIRYDRPIADQVAAYPEVFGVPAE